ncbi:MAG: type I pullulanase [bacterium]|nr:type I pullulanase [bacterium]
MQDENRRLTSEQWLGCTSTAVRDGQANCSPGRPNVPVVHGTWRGPTVFALTWCLFGPAASAGEITARVELPDSANGHRAFWAVRQNGQIGAAGAFDCDHRDEHQLSVAANNGPAVLYLAVNRDEYESYFPSFGDLAQRVAFEVTDQATELVVARGGWQERRLAEPGAGLTLHYHRFDDDYQAVGIWTWDEHNQRMPAEQETFEVGRDDFGLIFQIDTSGYGRPGDRIGLLPRLKGNWAFKDGGDRFWSSDLGREVYLVQGKSEVFRRRPDIRPRLIGASVDSENEVIAWFTHHQPVVDFPADRFTIRSETGEQVEVASVDARDKRGGKARGFRLRLAGPLNVFKRTYKLAVAGFAPRRIRLGGVLVKPGRFDDPTAVLGAHYDKEATEFRVFSPVADAVEVILADVPTGKSIRQAAAMTVNENGVWSARVPGDWNGSFYAYRLRGPGLDPEREVTDIYARCTTGRRARALIVDPAETNPPGFDPGGYVSLESPVDAVIYEMHVRDFTIADNSGVQHKGKFLGLTEPGTHLPGDPSIKTGLDHLVELGVTHVQIMPIQDFDNDEAPGDSYNWGYMPVFFNSPDGWYATVPVGPERISEFKRVVQALHDRGIGMIMDVVYNHTAKWASFESLVPGYYFRRRPDGSFWNGSGCGNELASEHPMARKYMIDSVKYWVTEYGIDGFRFDLMGLHDLETMTRIRDELRKINPSILVYGEPWTGGASGLKRITNQQRVAGTGLAAFNDHLRDAIKGDRDGGGPGFIQVGDRVEALRQGIRAAIDDWADQPTECISYCACHDNLTTWDKLLQSVPDAPLELKKRMQRFAGLLVLTSQGIAFIHGGQELCRSKGGSHNSYNLPDSVNRIDWSLKKKHRDVFDYYQGLIALRKAHPAFRLRTAKQIRSRLKFLTEVPTARCVAYTIDGTDLPGEAHAVTLVLLNGGATDQTFDLPAGTWHLLADSNRAGTESLGEVQNEARVAAHSGMVLGR